MILNNLLIHLGEYLSRNRQRIFKAFGIAIAALALFLLIVAGVEKWKRAKYEKQVNALEQQFKDADAKAKEAERQAEILKNAIDAKYDELRAIRDRAEASENRLRQTRTVYVPLKEDYEKVRNTPMPTGPVSCADICAELERLGFPCR